MHVDCPHCGHWIVLPEWAGNRRARCLSCRKTFLVSSAKPARSDRPPADEQEILQMLQDDSQAELAPEQLELLRNELGGAGEPEDRPTGADSADTSVDLNAISSSDSPDSRLVEYLERLKHQRRDLLKRLGIEAHKHDLPRQFAIYQAKIKEVEVQIRHVDDEMHELEQSSEGNISLERRAELLGGTSNLRRRLDHLTQRLNRRCRRLGKAIFLHEQLPNLPHMLYRQIRQVQERIEVLNVPPRRR